MALHNYARKRCAIGFVRSEHRTAQNDKFSPLVRGKLLGFVVSGKGIKVDPAKVKAIQEIPLPHSEKDVRGFLVVLTTSPASYLT